MKSNIKKSNILSIKDVLGNTLEDQGDIQNAFIDHFTRILAPVGQDFDETPDLSTFKVSGKLSQDVAENLCKLVERAEIENAIKYSSSNKSPGPDNFNAYFYKICWPIIGEDIIAAIKKISKKESFLSR